MTDPFNSSRDKRQYQKFRGADETYAELVGRVKKEGKDGFVKKMGLPLSMRDDVGDRFCGFHDLVSDERSDHLKARCHCLLYTSPSPRDLSTSRMPSSA